MEKDLNEIVYKILYDRCYEVAAQGSIFGNRYIIVDKFIGKDGSKLVVFFDLFEGKIHRKDIGYFTHLVDGMHLQFTKDIINIDYANKER